MVHQLWLAVISWVGYTYRLSMGLLGGLPGDTPPIAVNGFNL